MIKPMTWFRITSFLSLFNVVAGIYAAGQGEPLHAATHVVVAMGFAWWARHVRQGRGRSGEESLSLREQVEQQAAALEDAQSIIASLSNQIGELHERVDFTERMLTQVRERQSLEKHPGT